MGYFTPPAQAHVPLPADDEQVEVVVVGGGPVGLAAALGLGARGLRVAVLEADESVCMGSRAICVSRHSLEVLDRLGVGAATWAEAVPWTGGRTFHRDREVLSFSMPSGPSDVWGPMVNISQSRLEQLLVDRAAEVPGVTVHWRTRVVSVRQDGTGVTVEAETPMGPASLRTAWVVAADGARSVVRELCGLRLEGDSYTGTYVIADIHWPSTYDAQRRVWFDPPSAPGGSLILHRQPDDIWRVDYQLAPDDDPGAESTEEAVLRRIDTHLEWLGDATPWTLEWSSLYRAHALSLPSYRHGRVLLAGDAAHLVPIFGVRGLNSGLEDADSLGWMLAAVAHGADEQLLDAWAVERRAAWEQNVAQADLSTRFMTPGGAGQRWLRDAVLQLSPEAGDLAPLINPRQSSATHARTSPLTGTPVATDGPAPGDPVPDVCGRAGGASLQRAAEGGFAVVAHADDAEDAREVADAIAARFATPARPLDLGEFDAEALRVQPGELLVLRPDGLVLERRGAPARAPASGSTSATGVVRTRAEELWTLLSEAVDSVPATDRGPRLAALALLLATEHLDPAALAQALARVGFPTAPAAGAVRDEQVRA